MNPLKTFCLVASLLAVACATPSHSRQNSGSLKPSKWLSSSDLESIPSINEITLNSLESMSVQEGAKLVDNLYHLSQINHELTPNFVPSPSNIHAYIVKPNGENVTANLNTLAAAAKRQSNFGEQEVTIFITGLPQKTTPVTKATRKLVNAYMQRYAPESQKNQQKNSRDYDNENSVRTESDEDNNDSESWTQTPTGNLVVIDLGSTLNTFERLAMLDIPQTGNMINKAILELIAENEMPHDIVHLVAQGVAAHVAGAAARDFSRSTGHQIRRITALDPSKILAKNPKVLAGLARGDAEFVDAIHTSVYGMGTPVRVGDVDFYPEGPAAGVPGADNVVEASMRATRYFAESVRPGNERNFPAVAANSLQQYKNNNGYGKRAYMGISTEFDIEGDYILEVNAKAPFGKNAPAQKQNSYHGQHQSWKKMNKAADYE